MQEVRVSRLGIARLKSPAFDKEIFYRVNGRPSEAGVALRRSRADERVESDGGEGARLKEREFPVSTPVKSLISRLHH